MYNVYMYSYVIVYYIIDYKLKSKYNYWKLVLSKWYRTIKDKQFIIIVI